MKNLISFILICCSIACNAQAIWPEFGVNASYTLGTLIQPNLIGNSNHIVSLTPSKSTGYRIALNYDNRFGISYDHNKLQQDYTIDHIYFEPNDMIYETGNYVQSISMSAKTSVVLFQLLTERGSTEFGIGTIQVSKISRSFDKPYNRSLSSDIFKNNTLIAQASLKRYIVSTPYCSLVSGMKITAGIQDIRSFEGRQQMAISYDNLSAESSLVPVSVEIMAEFNLDFSWIYTDVPLFKRFSCRRKKGWYTI